ncbi:haloacid dehalogenase [Streptomyces corynorhini]|uniref:Haloacid dehalogenase n=1 Tax=Streptomyces corynorhini TaxID=2282652 RepID=A0A370B9N5_9ACTN|nr:haloacid dehalogenase [Streptomyces corynorhini]
MFFSVDCILVPGSSLSRLVEECLGLSGASGVHEKGQTDALRWTGIPEKALHTQLAGLPMVPGIAETTQWCWRNGLVPIISSLGWTPIGAHLADRFGFHSYSGRFLDAMNGRFTGRAGTPVTTADQIEFVRRRADDLGVAPTDCAAVGACPTDGLVFDNVGLGVAFNAAPDIRARATTYVEDKDLRAVIPELERLTVSRV